jgi:Fe-S cluster assembly ATP-binding protein
MLAFENVTVSAGKKRILENVSFVFQSGKTYVLMGPNGCGKSTLANTAMGHPAYAIARGGRIRFGKRIITRLAPEDRARFGIFLSFQNPLPLPGISVRDLLRLALEGKIDPVTLHDRITTYARELRIKDELLSRSLNDAFSGGEKKKLEALQAVLLTPTIVFFDEIDTGVDVDALKLIVRFLKHHLPKETALIFITHSTRLLRSLKPDTVIVMKNGRLVKQGTAALARDIERRGFDWITPSHAT